MYGYDIGPSSIVHAGRVIQIGAQAGKLDAHVRGGCLVLRCNDGPGWEMTFNGGDAHILAKVAAFAARDSGAELPGEWEGGEEQRFAASPERMEEIRQALLKHGCVNEAPTGAGAFLRAIE